MFALVQGNAATVLANPYSILLTESTAKALFGTEDPMNKTVRFDNKDNLTVTGILKELPANSTFQFSYLVPFSYLEATDDFTHTARHRNFEWNGFMTYVQLKQGVSYEKVAAKIRDIEKVDKDNIMSVVTNVILHPEKTGTCMAIMPMEKKRAVLWNMSGCSASSACWCS